MNGGIGGMFDNIGNKVKGLAKAVFWISFIGSVLGSLGAAIAVAASADCDDNPVMGFAAVMIFLVGSGIGFLVAWIGSWVIYCVGDTNVKVTGMQEELAKLRIQPVREEQKRPAPQRQDADRRAADAPEAKPEQPSDGQTEASPEKRIVCAIPAGEGKVKCPVCGSVQNAGRSICWECGAKFRDDEA
jgi:hypothetical protein